MSTALHFLTRYVSRWKALGLAGKKPANVSGALFGKWMAEEFPRCLHVSASTANTFQQRHKGAGELLDSCP